MAGEICLILHRLRSAHNVGAIFRTAEAAGLRRIYLTGYTPAPRDRFGRVNQEIVKTALGAERLLGWEKVYHPARLFKKLRAAGYHLVALEQVPGAVDYRLFTPAGPTALIVGNETRGLDRRILDQCDRVVAIPMRGKKESLNVSVAAGIMLFHLTRF